MAVLLAATAAAAAWALAGPVVASLVVLGCSAAALVVLRMLLAPTAAADRTRDPWPAGPPTTFTGFWRMQADLQDATKSLAAWHYGVRRRLQNLLAARLSERYGVSLTGDPQAARRLLNSGAGRHDLWQWMDPQRPIPPDTSAQPGIPPAVLAALINRLEHL